MTTKKIKSKLKAVAPPVVNQFDDLFSGRSTTDGEAVVKKATSKLILEKRIEADAKLEGAEPGTARKPTSIFKLDVLRTVHLAEDWNLRTAAIGRAKSDNRLIFVLSSVGGWTFAGMSDDPLTGRGVANASVSYIVPSLIAEVVANGDNPILVKLPIEKRVVAYMSALSADVTGVIRRAVKASEREHKQANPREKVTKLPKKGDKA